MRSLDDMLDSLGRMPVPELASLDESGASLSLDVWCFEFVFSRSERASRGGDATVSEPSGQLCRAARFDF